MVGHRAAGSTELDLHGRGYKAFKRITSTLDNVEHTNKATEPSVHVRQMLDLP